MTYEKTLRGHSFLFVASPSEPALSLKDWLRSVDLYHPDESLKTLGEIEKEVIQAHMRINGGQMSESARTLDIGRSTLYRKIEPATFGYIG